MFKVLAIALNTYREAIRNRILYIFVFFALGMMISSGVVSTLAIGEHEKIMRYLGLFGIEIFGIMIALFVGIGLVYNDIERKTLYTIVSKPIDRKDFILGKYFGLLLTIYVVTLLMTLFFFSTLHFQHYKDINVQVQHIGTSPSQQEQIQYLGMSMMWSLRDACVSFITPLMDFGNNASLFSQIIPQLTVSESSPQFEYLSGVMDRTEGMVIAVLMIWLEFGIIVSFAILYSAFTTPFLAFFLTTVTFIIGKMNIDIMRFVDYLTRRTPYEELAIGGKISYYLAHFAAMVSPNLTYYNLRYQLIYEGAFPSIRYIPEVSFIAHGIIYALIYTSIILIFAIAIFNRRNFK
jgi:ABC-type transport system involved in multi-copper enzyme maturation permease subunit